VPLVSSDLASRLYTRARAERWTLELTLFHAALERSVAKSFTAKLPAAADVERYLTALHLEDLALACACAAGVEAAWEHFILQHRPSLYRAAETLDRTGGAREIADSLYADLYGLQTRDGERQSLFRYFHGRSSLATWLRAVLAQRHIDRVRVTRRLEPLPEEEPPAPATSAPDPDRARYLGLLHATLSLALGALNDRDRLRLALYYAQELPLAKVGAITRESEATVSRQLARTRRHIREDVERRLAADERLSADQIARCFECAAEEPGALDLKRVLGGLERRKEIGADRSI
jgi:RNA polymerase sigma-70 factor (ECF subfamily)